MKQPLSGSLVLRAIDNLASGHKFKKQKINILNKMKSKEIRSKIQPIKIGYDNWYVVDNSL